MEGARGGTGPGLPRHTFADDPFFRDTPAGDVFREFGSPSSHHRRFGSNPRIFDDDFFDNFSNSGGGFGTEPSFFRSSLPRRSPAPMFERPANTQRQQTTPQRSPIPQRKDPSSQHNSQLPRQQQQPLLNNNNNHFHQRQSSSGSNYDNYHHPTTQTQYSSTASDNGSERQPGEKVHVIKVQHQPSSQNSPAQSNNGPSFVEINKASPNSYTNGQLNPDKRGGGIAETVPGVKIPDVKIEDYGERMDESSPKRHHPSTLRKDGYVYHSNPAISEQPIPLPAPAIAMPGPKKVDHGQALKNEAGVQKIESNNTPNEEFSARLNSTEEKKPREKEVEETIPEPKKFVPLASCSEQLIGLLDDAERRVDQLRETVSQLEQEKEALLDTINNVKMNAEFLKLASSEQDEVNMHADRILKRCKAVDVVVNTVRNEDQARALEDVNRLIDGVVARVRDDVIAAKDTIERFLNACSPDEPPGPIDQRFQTKIVECAADDQKRVRRRLMQIIGQLERSQRTFPDVK